MKKVNDTVPADNTAVEKKPASMKKLPKTQKKSDKSKIDTVPSKDKDLFVFVNVEKGTDVSIARIVEEAIDCDKENRFDALYIHINYIGFTTFIGYLQYKLSKFRNLWRKLFCKKCKCDSSVK